MTRRVVITGLGTVNSLCSNVPGFWEALCAGRSGIGPIEQFDTTAFKVKFGGEVKNWNPETVLDGKTARRLDRFAQFAQVAALDAVKDSGVEFAREDPYRCGVIIGSGIVGSSVAYHLAQAGCTNVLVIEREAHQGREGRGRGSAGNVCRTITRARSSTDLPPVPRL